MTTDPLQPQSPNVLFNRLLFRVAFARARPCYCYGCICLTPEERAYQRRVFHIARIWARQERQAAQRDKNGSQAPV